MDRKAFRLVGFVSVAVALSSSPACKDDSEVNNERPLPGPGPIGAGGGASTAGGAAGAAGVAGGGAGGATAGGTGGTATGGMGTGGMPTTCPMLAGDAKVRLANLSPGAGMDLCVKGPGKADFEGPLFQCVAGSGVPYKKVSKGFAFAPGAYEFRTVAPGVSCATAVASATITLAAGDTFIATAFGGVAGAEPATLKAFKNDPVKQTDQTLKLRFIHGINKAFPLDLGISAGGQVAAAVFSNVPYADISPNGMSLLGYKIDQGYAQGVSEFADGVEVGAAKTGEMAAIFSATVKLTPVQHNLTAYGAGTIGDASAPVSAFLCDDDVDDGNFQKCDDAVPVP